MAGETILVVDDDADIRKSLLFIIEKEGYHVITASDGNEVKLYIFTYA